MTILDFIGVYDPVTRLKSGRYLPGMVWDICSYGKTVVDQKGLTLQPTAVHKSLARYDMAIVPGGPGTRKLMHDRGFLSWLKTMNRVPVKVSVCTGALLLGAAGFLKGKKAATHHDAQRLLRPFCRQVVRDKRIVDEGGVITAGGVTSSLDLGLYLCEKLSGPNARREIAEQIEYDDTRTTSSSLSGPDSFQKPYWTVDTWSVRRGRESHFLRYCSALAKDKLTLYRDAEVRGLFWSPAKWENSGALESWRNNRAYKRALAAINNDVLQHTTHRMEGVTKLELSRGSTISARPARKARPRVGRFQGIPSTGVEQS